MSVNSTRLDAFSPRLALYTLFSRYLTVTLISVPVLGKSMNVLPLLFTAIGLTANELPSTVTCK